MWNKNKKNLTKNWIEAEVSLAEEFILSPNSSERLVENKKGGISYKIPKDWLIGEDNSSFYTSDKESASNRSDVLESGCRAYVYVTYFKLNIDELEKVINESLNQLSSVMKIDEFQRIEVNGKVALKNKYTVESLKMSYISIDIPFKNKAYKILLSSPIEENERCAKEFDDFLKTVSID